MDGQQSRHADPLNVEFAHPVTRCLGCNHADVHIGGGNDLVEADVEAVGEHEGITGFETRGDGLPVDGRCYIVRDEDHDDVRLLGGLGYGDDP